MCIFPDEPSPVTTNTYKQGTCLVHIHRLAARRLDEFQRTTDLHTSPEDKENLNCSNTGKVKLEDLAPSILPPRSKTQGRKTSSQWVQGAYQETTPLQPVAVAGTLGHIARRRELIEEERAKGCYVSRQPKIDFGPVVPSWPKASSLCGMLRGKAEEMGGRVGCVKESRTARHR